MHRLIKVVPLLCLLIGSCAKKDATRLEKGSPIYQLALDIALKLPYMDPDKNQTVVYTNQFELATGEVVTTLHQTLGPKASQISAMDTAQLREFISQKAEEFAVRKLLLEAAHEAKVTVAETEIDSILDPHYTRAGGQEQFESSLASSGITIETMRKDVRAGLTIQRHLDSVVAKQVSVSDREVEVAYAQDKTATVRHILLLTNGKDDSAKAEIRKKMEDILAKAKVGEDFASLAKEHTEDPGSKGNGGLYENFPKGRMVKPFEDAAFTVPVGQISDIVETPYGFHILKVINRKKETKPLEEVRDDLKKSLKARKQQEDLKTYLDALKKDSGFKLAEL